jgi:hypothetical protein
MLSNTVKVECGQEIVVWVLNSQQIPFFQTDRQMDTELRVVASQWVARVTPYFGTKAKDIYGQSIGIFSLRQADGVE